MKISVIIPAYNEEENLGATLDAILASDYPDFEVIVVDNASKDKTSDVATKKGVRVVHEKRKGTMWACEAGRKIARGEIIVRLDADCLPSSHWLARGAGYFRNPRVAAVSGPYHYFDAPKSFRHFALFCEKYMYAPMSALLSALNIGGIIIGGNSFMRASYLEQIGGFDTSITFYGDDTDVARRLSAKGKIVFDRQLILKTSGRRFKNEGTLKIISLYIFHFFRVLFVSKS